MKSRTGAFESAIANKLPVYLPYQTTVDGISQVFAVDQTHVSLAKDKKKRRKV